jgi:PKHD-type hydroxylase
MNLKNYYWYFTKALSDSFCDELIKYGNSKQEQLALTGGQTLKIQKNQPLTDEDIKDLKQKRDSNVVWLNDRWIYDEIQPYINTANKNADWNFDWDFSESCQFTKYKLDQYYDWHCDSWEKPYDNPNDINTNGKIRKLSVTCSLSDPEDYEGGELEFDFRNMDPDKPQNIKICDEIKPRGSIVVFPSHVWHRVKPVTKGTRYSLVIWNIGKPFK